MKKNLLILTLALLIALPVFGLAAAALTPETTAPLTGFVDAYKDGLCDNCGNELGKNTDAPNYIDENKNGICDHFGTNEQGQGQGSVQGMRDLTQNTQGRGQGMMSRSQQAQSQGDQGNVQGQNNADADNDGVCDNFGTNTQRNFGPSRTRR